ncbi:hypothetical protein HMSSN036_32590 [Paenibacillus macerans]|nr:hypothetical protein HMSSN036_32590 [Paenibacillus macerans]
MFESIPDIILIPVVVIAVILVLGLAFWARYKTVSPDEAMIVTGSFLGNRNISDDQSGRKIKIVRGGGAFIWPIFQKAEYLSLLSHKLDVMTPEVYTEQGVPVSADGVAIIKVGSSIEDVATAAEQFMGKPIESLKGEAQEVLEGHLRSILGSMTVEEVYRNRDKFAQEVQGVAARDLKKMGLQIVSFTIKDVRDKHGYLEALGKPRIAAVKRDADIAEAEALRDARIQKAMAEESGQKAELLRDTNIAEAEKEKELKIASFKKEQDTAKADADQAYFIQEARAKQIAVEEQMKVELVRKEREIDLQDKEITVRQKQYDAEVKKKSRCRPLRGRTGGGSREGAENAGSGRAAVLHRNPGEGIGRTETAGGPGGRRGRAGQRDRGSRDYPPARVGGSGGQGEAGRGVFEVRRSGDFGYRRQNASRLGRTNRQSIVLHR